MAGGGVKLTRGYRIQFPDQHHGQTSEYNIWDRSLFGESGEVWEGGEGKIKWKQDEEGMEERRSGCMCVTEKTKQNKNKDED